MRVWTEAVFDIETSQLVTGEYFDYDGPVAECKGSDIANQQRIQELKIQQDSFNQQMQMLNDLKTQMAQYMTPQGEGYTPQQYTAMQSQFLNNNAAQFQNAGQSVRQALLARGSGAGDMPIGGDYTRGIASLMGAAASSQAQGLLGLQQQNAQQALANKFNTASLLSGNAATLTGPQGAASSGASSALNSYIQAKNTGFTASLMNSLGSNIGKGFGAIATGGTAWG